MAGGGVFRRNTAPLEPLGDREHRVLHRALLLRLEAPRPEVAAARRVGRRGHVPREDDPLAVLAPRGVGDRDGGEQRLRVGVRGVLVDLLVRARLDDAAEVHDGDAVGDVADDREVVRDEDVGEVELLLEPLHEVDDLRLHRDVEGRHGLVGDDDLGAQRETARDADALPLAAGELVRVAVDVLGVEPDDVEEFLHALAPVPLRRDLRVDVVRLADDVADRHPGVERGVRVLEDHLDVAAHRLQGAAGELRDVLALVADRAARGLLQVDEHLGDGRLAAAGLADDAEGLAAPQVEVDTVDGLHGADLALEDDALGEREVLGEAPHFEDRLAGRVGVLLVRLGHEPCGLAPLAPGLPAAAVLIAMHRGSPSSSGRRWPWSARPRRAAGRRAGSARGRAGSGG
ncbi:putative peptide ABC transporter ATP-binding protein [Streptomyces sp. Tu6071]|nr:putative peptide ABC transporter ATP-binding protein [Streptomyces sp. Tu6071]